MPTYGSIITLGEGRNKLRVRQLGSESWLLAFF